MKKSKLNNAHFNREKLKMVKQSGFTLVELMVVVAIIGILSAVVAPTYRDYITSTKRTDAKLALLEMADDQDKYYLQNNTYASTLTLLYGAATKFSKKDLYQMTISAGDVNSFSLTATALTEQQDDTGCTIMTFNQAGTKTPAACWE